jgi:uncharacterized protein (UPF0335 family)
MGEEHLTETVRIYSMMIPALSAINVALITALISIYWGTQRKLIERLDKVVERMEKTDISIALITKDVNELYKDCDTNKNNVYEVRTVLQTHHDRIHKLEYKKT